MRTRLWAKTLPSGARLYANPAFVGTDGTRTYTVMMEKRGRLGAVVIGPSGEMTESLSAHLCRLPGVAEALEEARRTFQVDGVMAA